MSDDNQNQSTPQPTETIVVVAPTSTPVERDFIYVDTSDSSRLNKGNDSKPLTSKEDR